jgi:hypothetical protein
MDKLQPILKQKFWILLGLAMIISLVGWWMATGSMAATIETRTKAIADAESKTNIGAEVPNDSWSTQLSEINQQQERLVKQSRNWLWQRQAAVMTWPETILDFVAQTPYRGEFPPIAREAYRNRYMYQVRDTWLTVRPLEGFPDGSGIVSFPSMNFPHRKWGDLPPTSQEMWEAQEDLWLYKPILQAIREVNVPDGTLQDASIFVIQKLELMGGDRSTIGQSPTQAGAMEGAGMMEGASAMGGLAESMPGAGGAGFGGAGARTGGSMGTTPADFKPTEEFGNAGGSGGGGGFGGGGGMSAASAEAMPEGDMGAGATATPARRYIDDEDSLPYKTRGFYLSVIMDHRRVPQLIAELTASNRSPWPVEIVRVQVSRINDDSPSSGGGMGGMMAGGMSSGGLSSGGMPPGLGAGQFSNPMPAFGGGGSSADFQDSLADVNGGSFSSGLPDDLAPGAGSAFDPDAAQKLATTQALFQTALTDPMMAQVTMAGLIYLFKPPEGSPEAESAEQADAAAESATPESGTAAPADPSAAPTTEPVPAAAPADPAATPTTPADPATTPADPAGAPASPAPAAPAEAPPAGESPTPPAATPPNESAPPPAATPQESGVQ